MAVGYAAGAWVVVSEDTRDSMSLSNVRASIENEAFASFHILCIDHFARTSEQIQTASV